MSSEETSSSECSSAIAELSHQAGNQLSQFVRPVSVFGQAIFSSGASVKVKLQVPSSVLPSKVAELRRRDQQKLLVKARLGPMPSKDGEICSGKRSEARCPDRDGGAEPGGRHVNSLDLQPEHASSDEVKHRQLDRLTVWIGAKEVQVEVLG